MPNLDLIKRKVNVREARNIEVFSLNEIMKHFADSEVLIVKQINVAAKLITLGKMDEAKDILRSQIVFIHECGCATRLKNLPSVYGTKNVAK